MSIDRLTTALEDRYAIEREIGAGGMATVYLAEDLKHHRKVAVKVLRPELAAILGAERFLKEIEVTAGLQHPNILPLYDSGEADTALYYVMPLVEGESLRDRLDREKQLGVEETASIARSVASALEYAHRHDVIHRDIKPENVMLTEGQAMVADFGIALAVSQAGGARLTETGLSLGTPYYMSPEQATGDRELDARSDVYALGCVTYEMLTGDPPHTGATAQAIIASVMTEDPRLVSARRPSVPPAMEAAVHKAIAKIPADRFATAAQFGEALVQRGSVASSVGTPSVQPAAASVWNRVSVVMTAVSVVLLAFVLLLLGRPEADSPVVRYSLSLPEGEELTPNEVRPRVVFSPDGNTMLYSGPGDTDSRLWIRGRDELRATPLFGTELARSPFFSPDGNSIGFPKPGGGGQELYVVSLSGGAPTLLLDTIVGLDGGSWGTDDFIYFDGLTGGGTRGIMRIPASGGTPEQVTTVDTARGETDHVWPRILPGARGVLFTIIRDNDLTDADIAVAEVGGEGHTVLARGVNSQYASSGHLLFVTREGTLFAAPFDADQRRLTGNVFEFATGLNVRGAGAVDLTVAEDGRRAYVTGALSPRYGELVMVDRAGNAEPIDSTWVENFSAFSISPDGSHLAVTVRLADFGGQTQVYVKPVEGGPPVLLTPETNRNDRPFWSPDGQSVLFRTDRAAREFETTNPQVGFTADIYSRRADAAAEAEPVLSGPEVYAGARYSPDGRWLLFAIRDSLYARENRPGAEPISLGLRAPIGDPGTLSPDGRWLAFTYNASDQLRTARDMDVFVVPFPNTGDGRWRVTQGGGFNPRWSPDGRELFYQSANGELTAVEIRAGPAFETGTRAPLFDLEQAYLTFRLTGYSYDVMPDGEHFIMVRMRAGVVGNELIVVENAFAELTAQSGN